MLFNSDLFLKFFAGFLLLYYICRHNLAARNILIVAASYLFYGWWDYRFLGLLILTSLMDYAVGLGLGHFKEAHLRKLILGSSIVLNLSLLGFFKYYNFFVESLQTALANLDIPINTRTLAVVLPVGISFYTFQSMSYALDVYRRDIPPTKNLINFLAYVSFFPQLVAGPIERAQHLLPQFQETRGITRAMLAEGIWLSLWGMFKKVVLADNFAPLVDMVYQNPTQSGPMVALGTLAFACQIYCDFSGYSDIARGTAKILGFDIMFNFRIPYAATNVRDFWKRWHISLSTWLRDYLYISLGGNRGGEYRTYRNLLLTMVLGGLWHGAAWNFAIWGLWHGVGLVIHRVCSKAGFIGGRALAWLLTTLFVLYSWLLFRAQSLEHIVTLTRSLAEPAVPVWFTAYCTNLGAFLVPLVAMEIWLERAGDLLAPLRMPRWKRAGLQGALLIGIILYWGREASPFIYFQF